MIGALTVIQSPSSPPQGRYFVYSGAWLSRDSPSKIAQLEQTIKDLYGQQKTTTGEQVLQHALLQIIHGCVSGSPKPLLWGEKQSKGYATGIPTLVTPDWHWDEFVMPTQVEHVNAYHREIAVQCAERCFRTFVDLTKNHLSKPSATTQYWRSAGIGSAEISMRS